MPMLFTQAVHYTDAAYKRALYLDPCAYCHAPAQHLDHITPRSVGGTAQWDNLTPACPTCNMGRKAMPLLLWLLRLQRRRDGLTTQRIIGYRYGPHGSEAITREVWR